MINFAEIAVFDGTVSVPASTIVWFFDATSSTFSLRKSLRATGPTLVEGDWGEVAIEGLTLVPLRGLTGAKGDKGDPGTPGAPGAPGKDGAPGTPGVNGTNGTNGTNGAPGPKGDPGTPGTPGIQGVAPSGCWVNLMSAMGNLDHQATPSSVYTVPATSNGMRIRYNLAMSGNGVDAPSVTLSVYNSSGTLVAAKSASNLVKTTSVFYTMLELYIGAVPGEAYTVTVSFTVSSWCQSTSRMVDTKTI